MRSGNPVLKESTFLDLGSGAVVSRDGNAMTLNGTVNKTGFLLLLTVLTAAFAWNQALGPDGTPAPGFAAYVWGGRSVAWCWPWSRRSRRNGRR